MTDDHRKKITSDIRKNNIFGERQDHIIKGFLALGGEAAFYNPHDENIMFGRSSSQLYVILIKLQEDPSEAPTISPEDSQNLERLANTMGGVAIYGINRAYCKSVKWFQLNGKKISLL